MRISSQALTLLLGLSTLTGSGCVTVYQPISGLQRPVAVDPQRPNFKDLRVRLLCPAGEAVTLGDAQALCQHVTRLLSDQGAIVREGGAPAEAADDDAGPGGGAPGTLAAHPPGADLEVELSSRLIHEETNPLLWTLSVLTLTLAPAMSETTVEQDVNVRSADGFLLASDTWQARFVLYFGVAIWAVNWVFDLTLRKPADKLTGGAMEKDFTRDVDRQLTQLLYNARSRRALLQPGP